MIVREPTPHKAALALALERFRRDDAEETSTVYCWCGSSFTWCSFDKDLDLWVEKHQGHEPLRGNGTHRQLLPDDGYKGQAC